MSSSNKHGANIFNDEAVFNYVAGHMDKKARKHFEARLESDQALQNAVEEERSLREQLLQAANEAESEESQSDADTAGLTSLLDRIDSYEREQDALKTSSSSTEPPWWQRAPGMLGAAMAASILTLAILVFMPDTTDSNYTLLSDSNDNALPSYQALVGDQRVAQLWFADDVATSTIENTLAKFQLTPLSRAGDAWVVSSEHALSDKDLEQLSQLPAVQRVQLVSNNP